MGEPSLFRSEDMTFLRMYVEKDAAHDFVEELGFVGKVEFRDLNPTVSAFQRPFAMDIKRCEEIQRKFRLFRESLKMANIEALAETGHAVPSIGDIEMTTADHEKELTEVTRHFDELTRLLNTRLEQEAILKKCSEIYDFSAAQMVVETPRDVDLEFQRDTDVRIAHLAGSLIQDKVETFERIVFRATRGNCFTSFRPMDSLVTDPRTGKAEQKCVFMVFFAGSTISKKIAKIAESFGASIYQFPEKPAERDKMLKELSVEIIERQKVLRHTADSRRDLLMEIAASLPAFEGAVEREIAIMHVLNMFEGKTGRRSMEAEGWCPRSFISDIQEIVERIGSRPNVPKPIVNIIERAPEEPPTHFETNKVTRAFQAIVDAYGIANYKEFNPMPFTVITFPFLFAVMFGDLGHGFLMLLFALYMVLNEKQFQKSPGGEIFMMAFGGRYVILFMALFSMFTGLLYNDTFAMSINFFGTAYEPICDVVGKHGCEAYHYSNYYLINGVQCPAPAAPCLPIYNATSRVYPFGVDPIWKQATNELAFTNSLKMKLSVVIGVIQMLFGVFLSGLNHVYYRNWISFVHEFVPQVLFMCSIFGFMVACMFIKWTTYYRNTHCAPSILGTFIDMFLDFGVVKPESGCDAGGFFEGQSGLEKVLIIVSFLSVPWMLFTKPLLMKRKHAAKTKGYKSAEGGDGDEFSPPLVDHGGHGGHDFDFAEEMVHQIIHTIEYVLGTVSNTASYLRLWALSLAHAQLSTVFWEKVMVDNMVSGNFLVIIIAFMVWTCCTFAVLMIMESLSAFLHALRLHWVEFQNKFYQATGRKFVPFRFRVVDL